MPQNTKVLLPDGTDLAQYARSIRWEHVCGKAPVVWVEFAATAIDAEANAEPAADAVVASPKGNVPKGLAVDGESLLRELSDAPVTL